MVKFSREYDATVIPEWKAAFVDYKCLKKLIKRVKITRRDDASAGHLLPPQEHHVGFSVVLDPVRALFSGKPALAHGAASPPVRDASSIRFVFFLFSSSRRAE
jgi:xenotropic and polytropic retrovirus receptor 1